MRLRRIRSNKADHLATTALPHLHPSSMARHSRSPPSPAMAAPISPASKFLDEIWNQHVAIAWPASSSPSSSSPSSSSTSDCGRVLRSPPGRPTDQPAPRRAFSLPCTSAPNHVSLHQCVSMPPSSPVEIRAELRSTSLPLSARA